MKRLLFAFILLAFASCKNSKYEFEDYESQSVYFPWQYPIRTLSLGNDAMDNSMDKAHRFSVGINVGGVWAENKRDWSVSYVVDNTLVTDYNLYKEDGEQKIQALPESWYSISPAESVVIPSGSIVGVVTVQLNDEFFSEANAAEVVKGNYVLPLRIVSSTTDKILSGVPIVDNPNIHVEGDWEVNQTPKDFTLFAVKYVNPHHGKFLRRYTIKRTDSAGQPLEDIVVRQSDPEKNIVVSLATESLRKVVTNFAAEDNSNSSMRLTVDAANNSVAVESVSGVAVRNGSGEWVYNGDAWGVNQDGSPKSRDVFRLKYEYTDDQSNNCVVYDTIVFRDRQIKFEEYSPIIVDASNDKSGSVDTAGDLTDVNGSF